MAHTKRGNFQFLGRYNYYYPTLPELFVLVMWFLIGVLLGNLVTLLITSIAGSEIATGTGMIISYPMMFLPAMIYASSRSRANMMNRSGLKVDNANFAPKGGALCAIFAVIGTLALSFVSDAITSLMPEMPEHLKALLDGVTKGNLFTNFICVSIYAAIFEEWLCRGIILRGLLGNGMKPVWAITVSAVFFAIIHANPWQAIPAVLIGSLFGYVYYRTGSLKLCMLMHFSNNTLALILSNINSLEELDSWKEIMPANLYWIVLIACIIVTILVVSGFHDIPPKYEKNSFEQLPSLFEER